MAEVVNAQPLSARGFLSTLGVDTHIAYTDGEYANIPNVIADLKYLGITQVRDGISNGVNGSAPLASYITLAQAGIQFTFIIDVSTTAQLNATLALINQVAAAVPGSVTAIEGPNEINNQPVTYNGVSGLQGALNEQADIYAAVHSDAALAGVPVDYFTGYGAGGVAVGPDPSTTPGLADYDTQHPYPNNGQAPGPYVARATALENETSLTAPAVYTETGYTTAQVNADVQAKYELDLLMDTAAEGISKTYLYDLMDAYAPGSPQGDDGYGLFDYTTAPKEAANALRALTSLLQDNGANAAGFVPTALTYSITGLPTTGNSLAIESSDGSKIISVWNEPQIWNSGTNTEISAAATAATVNLGASYASVTVYDPLQGTNPTATYSNASTVTINVTDHPILIKFSGTASTSPLAVSVTSQTLASDTGASATDGITRNGAVALTGTYSGAASSIVIYNGTKALGTAVLGNGTWRYSTTLSQGSYALYAVITGTSGSTASTAVEPTITVETTAPGVAITTPAGTLTTSASTAAVALAGSLTGLAGTTVQILDGTKLLGFATVSGNSWSYAANLAIGSHSITALATDLAGNQTTSTADAITVAAASTPPGSDTLTLNVAEIAKSGEDAQFTVSVDGKQIGGVLTATASETAGAAQNITLTGNFGTGPHQVAVTYLTGFTGNQADYGRTLFLNAITFDNATIFPDGQFAYNTTATYTVQAPSPAVPSNIGTTDTLVLNLAETAVSGQNAQFLVSVDGQITGNVQTVTASHAAGQSQNFTLTGNFHSGSHVIAIDFLNGFAGNPADNGRQLYVNSITLDGLTTTENTYQSYIGSQNYTATSGTSTSGGGTSPLAVSVTSQTLASDTGAATTVAAGKTLTINGTESLASLLNNGTVSIGSGDRLNITGDVEASSEGIFQLTGKGTMEIAALLGADAKIQFLGGNPQNQLIIDNPANFGSLVGAAYAGPALEDFLPGDRIDLKVVNSAGLKLNYSESSGNLQVTGSGGATVATLHFLDASLSGKTFHAASDGATGTLLTIG